LDTLTFIAKLVEHAAWPLAGITAVWLLRKEVQGLLGAIRRLKAGPVEVEIEKVVAELRETKQIAATADAKADLAVERLGATEPDVPDGIEIPEGTESIEFRFPANVTVTQNERNVLVSLLDGHYTARSMTGVSKATELSTTTVNRTLASLVSKGLSAKIKSSDGRILWVATAAGKAVARAAYPPA
jgi:hypothetical protein